MKKFILSAIVVFGFSITSLQGQTRGRDYTPAVVQSKYYKWGGQKKEWSGIIPPPVERRWYSKYTSAMPGYVVLKSGEKIKGSIVIRKRWNEASKIKVVDEKGTKRPHPDGVSVIEDVQVNSNGSSKTYRTLDLRMWGCDFKKSEWSPKKKSKIPAQTFNRGKITLTSGDEFEGFICLTPIPKSDLPQYDVIYFAKNESEPVDIYLAWQLDELYQNFKPKKSPEIMVNYVPYISGRKYMIQETEWIEQLLSAPKKIDYRESGTGEMTLKSKEVLKGMFFFAKDRYVREFFYLSDENRLVHFSSIASVAKIVSTLDGKTEHYFEIDNILENSKDFLAKLEKKDNLLEGTIFMLDGSKLEGRIGLRRNENLVKSYRTIFGYYYFTDGDEPEMTEFTADDPIDYVFAMVDGVVMKYVSDGGIYVKFSELLENITSKESKDPTKVLQPGFIRFKDEVKKSGFILQANKSFYYWVSLDKKEIERYRTNDPSVNYIVQQVGEERRKFTEKDGKWIEIFQPYETYCYYRNPSPTHKKAIASALTNVALKQITKAAQAQLADEGAQAVAQANYNSSGNAVKSAQAGAQFSNDTKEAADQIIQQLDDNPLELYYLEWVIVNRKTGKEFIVFQKNDVEILSVMLQTCSTYMSMDDKEQKKLLSYKNIDEAVRVLNSCD
ncbi:MAG: hypothetical protein KDC83_07045 [Flavobacteriales bacterium]|nr:hypothetical protein [Flavobacteriales bacterium]